MKIKKVEFLTSAADVSSLPKSSIPSVAFAGRSNVGKSSLINALLNRKNIARTSSAPGKTRLINYFTINDKLHMVDLPGYGFAKLSHKMQNQWQQLIESFLLNNRTLRLVFVIIDIRRSLMDIDIQLLDWLDYNGLNSQIILTKCDKVSKNEALKICRNLVKQRTLINEPILFSAVKRIGISEVWKVIYSACSS